MKVKRIKRANRILTFFKYNYNFVPPFRVLVDGTFCKAALANKINLREQMPKYLGGDVEIVTTKCVLAELEILGSPVYGALVICRQFVVDICPHTPCRTPAECLAHLARRAAKKGTRYIIATNDDFLADKLRTIAGTPILYIKYNAILLDRVSQVLYLSSKYSNEGANPLSCKKKKVVLTKQTKEPRAKGRRKRSKRQRTIPMGSTESAG
uniref:rRNA-processing protein UTP23 homolog n=1 Tax=Angiostrongylus cantonensis TaxID=6313 RepID=A0A158P924_ANGCA